MGRQSVSFKAVKQAVTFEQVLNQCRVEGLRKNANGLVGRCPLHGGTHEDEFRVNLERKIYHCFTCGRGGDLISFVKEIEGVSEREAALLLVKALHLERELLCVDDRLEERWVSSKQPNPPLPFTLQLDPEHPYLAKRGISVDTAKRFGAGYYSGSGMMRGRVCITLKNEDHQAIAYIGRAIDDSLPTYKWPPRFQKSQELYNYWYAAANAQHGWHNSVILVQDFFSCMALHQNFQENVVALMGAELYPDQEHLLISTFEQVTLVLDGDRTGHEATRKILERLSGKIARSVVELPWDARPDTMHWRDLGGLIRKPKVLDKWVPRLSS